MASKMNYLTPMPLSTPVNTSSSHIHNSTPTTNGATNGLTNGATNGVPKSYAQDIWFRYGQLKSVEDTKNTLIEDLLNRYDSVVHQCHDLIAQADANKADPGEKAKLYAQQRDHLQRILDRNPFVVVLIDGNSILFSDNYIRGGELGGKAAAAVLRESVFDWVPGNVISPPSKFQVTVKVYADFKSLANKLLRAGVIESPSIFGDFARGFSSLYDFVDIGNADLCSKLMTSLNLHMYDYHCHQIFFGGDPQLLDLYKADSEVVQRVALLEGIESGAEHVFRTARFKQIFRRNELLPNAAIVPRTATPVSVSSANHGIPQGLPSPIRPNSVTSSITSNDVPGAKTWAKLAKAVASQPQADLVPRVTEAPRPSHNKKGQRIDPPIDIDYDELQRVKKIKMCNMHYLHPDGCKWPASKCNHTHVYKPTPEELKTLRCVSRETPCHNGVECDELVCVYGHRCPYPAAKDGSMRGISCVNGSGCRFPREMHGIKNAAPARSTNNSIR